MLSLETGAVTGTVAPAYWPQAVAVRADGARAVALSADDGGMEEFDLTGASVASTGQTSGDPAEPLAATYGGSRLAAVSYGWTQLALWQPPAAASTHFVPDGGCLWDVAGNADGTRFFMADYCGQGRVHSVDGAGTLLGEFDLATQLPPEAATSASPVALALAPDGSRLYVANYDTDSSEAADDVMVFSVGPAGQLAFLKRVLLVDADDAGLVADLYNSVGMAVSPDGRTVWVAYDAGGSSALSGGGVAVYDTVTDRVDVLPLGASHPCEVALEPVRGRAYLTGYDYAGGQGEDKIWLVDTAARSVLGSVDLAPGAQPTGIALF